MNNDRIIFAALGPFLAWLICIALLFAVAYPKPIFDDEPYWFSSVMVAYALSILPLLFTAWIDRRLADKWWRPIACFAAGFAIALVLYFIFTHEGGRAEEAQGFYRYWFYVGLVWGLPAAVCSWLAGMDRKERAALAAPPPVPEA